MARYKFYMMMIMMMIALYSYTLRVVSFANVYDTHTLLQSKYDTLHCTVTHYVLYLLLMYMTLCFSQIKLTAVNVTFYVSG